MVHRRHSKIRRQLTWNIEGAQKESMANKATPEKVKPADKTLAAAERPLLSPKKLSYGGDSSENTSK